jgi:hypothetical protein
LPADGDGEVEVTELAEVVLVTAVVGWVVDLGRRAAT